MKFGSGFLPDFLRLRDWLDALAFSLSGLDCTGKAQRSSVKVKSRAQPKRTQHIPGTTCAAMAFTMEELHWEGSRGLAYPKARARPSGTTGTPAA